MYQVLFDSLLFFRDMLWTNLILQKIRKGDSFINTIKGKGYVFAFCTSHNSSLSQCIILIYLSTILLEICSG